MKASSLSFKAAVLFVLTGMVMGIAMAAIHDHSVFPAHAHLNLIGWVSLFLIGIYYRLNPPLDMSRAALVQVVVWILGTIVLTIELRPSILVILPRNLSQSSARSSSLPICCSLQCWCSGRHQKTVVRRDWRLPSSARANLGPLGLVAVALGRGCSSAKEQTYAFYNPPWTLPFLRHNEVMVETAGPRD